MYIDLPLAAAEKREYGIYQSVQGVRTSGNEFTTPIYRSEASICLSEKTTVAAET
jgi:hypothetical protein